MKVEEVPQDNSTSLGGEKKRIYARDASGRYTTALSSGWDAEEVVLQQALEVYERSRQDALSRARQGTASPLEYHMYDRRMDIVLLSQSTGFCKWRVRRHLRTAVFARLPRRILSRYEQALGLSAHELMTLPVLSKESDVSNTI